MIAFGKHQPRLDRALTAHLSMPRAQVREALSICRNVVAKFRMLGDLIVYFRVLLNCIVDF